MSVCCNTNRICLVREARSKRKYDLARLKLLGIEEEGPFDDGDDDEDDG
jgi:hypothetical protein